MPELDFFDDLGGHSLLAARLVSMLRGDARYAALERADHLPRTPPGRHRPRDGTPAGASDRQPPRPTAPRTPLRRRFVCALAQALIIPLFILLHIADWLAPFFVYHYFTGDPGDSISLAVLYSLAMFVLARFVNFAHRHCRQTAGSGPAPGRALSAVGRGLFSLVAGQQILRTAGRVSARGHAVDAAVSARAGRPHRPRRDD